MTSVTHVQPEPNTQTISGEKSKTNGHDKRAQLEAFRRRQEELRAEIAAARTELEKAQSDLIYEVPGAAETATTLQAGLTAKEGTLAILGRLIEALSESIELSDRAPKIEADKAEMVRLAQQASDARDRFVSEHVAFADLFEATMDRVISARYDWAVAGRAFLKLSRSLVGDGMDGRDLAEELESQGCSLDAVLSEYLSRAGNFSGRRFRFDLPKLGRFGVPITEAIQKSQVLDAVEAERQRRKDAKKH